MKFLILFAVLYLCGCASNNSKNKILIDCDQDSLKECHELKDIMEDMDNRNP